MATILETTRGELIITECSVGQFGLDGCRTRLTHSPTSVPLLYTASQTHGPGFEAPYRISVTQEGSLILPCTGLKGHRGTWGCQSSWPAFDASFFSALFFLTNEKLKLMRHKNIHHV